MASKHSKKTLALLVQFPGFYDWIINNFTPDQLIMVKESQFDTVWFGEGHPLNSQELCVQLWRAYRGAVVFELKCRWGNFNDHARPPAGSDPFVYFHQSVCNAIGLFVGEQPELLDEVVKRHRCDIEMSTGPGRLAGNLPKVTKRKNRL